MPETGCSPDIILCPELSSVVNPELLSVVNPELLGVWRQRTLDSSEKIRFHLAEYAEKNGKSEAYLIREFRKQYSVSPYQYLLTRKLETARQLLRYSNLSIKEIAEQLCFSDQYYFSNCFKKTFGLSPKFFKQS